MDSQTLAVIAAGVLVVVTGVQILLVIEVDLLARGRSPITSYTRALIQAFPAPAFLVGSVLIFVAGALGAHFYWDAGCG